MTTYTVTGKPLPQSLEHLKGFVIDLHEQDVRDWIREMYYLMQGVESKIVTADLLAKRVVEDSKIARARLASNITLKDII